MYKMRIRSITAQVGLQSPVAKPRYLGAANDHEIVDNQHGGNPVHYGALKKDGLRYESTYPMKYRMLSLIRSWKRF